MSISAIVRRSITKNALCSPGTRVLVALSGGSDSVALFWLLKELADAGDFELAGLAHFNHQLRATADRDEAFCRELGARASVPIVVGTADVSASAKAEGLSIEDAARRARYAFLEQAAKETQADRIATGHTLDDQAETFLLKLARGAGLTGLGGIYPSRGRVIRPLLELDRSDLRAYLDARGERWVEDETNADLSNPRNRVRHVLLPEFERTLGSSVRETIARAAALAREDGAWLDTLAAERLDSLASRGRRGLELNATQLRDLPAPLLRRVLLQAMRTAIGESPGHSAGHKEISLAHVERSMDVLGGMRRGVEFPGGRWELIGGKMVLVSNEALRETLRETLPGARPISFSYALGVPGEVRVPEAGCAITAEWLSRDASLRAAAQTTPMETALVAGMNADGLVVRSRKPGDRIRLTRMGGRRKLQDIFVDAKVPRIARDRTPLVVSDDRIVWVPGTAISADFRVSGGEDAVILLKFTRLESLGGKA